MRRHRDDPWMPPRSDRYADDPAPTDTPPPPRAVFYDWAERGWL